MNETDCMFERFSVRTLGFIFLPIGMLLAMVGTLILPVVGWFFAVPVMGLSALFIAAPRSQACRLVVKNTP